MSSTRTAAMANSHKIATLLERGACQGSDTVDIYRTDTVGTASSRLHRDVLIGRLRFLPDGPDEFAVIDPRGQIAGTVRRDRRETGRTEETGWRGRTVTVVHETACWSAHDYDSEAPRGWLGYFDTVSAAMSALLT